MRIKNCIVLFITFALLTSIAGCETSAPPTIPKPDVPMKTQTIVSDNNLITVSCELPEGWELYPLDFFSVFGTHKSNMEKKFTYEEQPPYMIKISSYERSGGAGGKEPEELIQMYKDMFDDKPERYKKFINYQILNTYYLYDAEASPQTDFLTEFKYKHYDGTKGKITEIQYSFEYQGKTFRQINCIRQDIPYIVTGAFDSSLEMPSGALALWVANSLHVMEDIPEEQ